METKPVATMTAEDWDRVIADIRRRNQAAVDATLVAFQEIGVAVRAAVDAFEDAARTFHTKMRRRYPDAFYADGTLRDNWAEIVGRDECGAQDA